VLGQPLLLQPLYSLLDSASTAQELLLDVARLAAAEAANKLNMTGSSGSTLAAAASLTAVVSSDSCQPLQVLHRLGWDLGVLCWQQDWRSSCCTSPPAGSLDSTMGLTDLEAGLKVSCVCCIQTCKHQSCPMINARGGCACCIAW
jgi:hypothetical protein